MLNTITWETFLTTVGTLTAGYYTLTVLFLYHKEIIHRFKTPSAPSITKPTASDRSASAIIGKIKPESTATRTSSVNPEEVNVASNDQPGQEEPDPIKIAGAASSEKDILLIGSVADLMQEIKTVFNLVADYKSDKAEVEALFRTLLLRYPHIRKTDYRLKINEYICKEAFDTCGFQISLAEANSWWEDSVQNG